MDLQGKELAMFKIIIPLIAVVSLASNGMQWYQINLHKKHINSLYAKQQTDWYINRASAFYELVLGRPTHFSSSYSTSPMGWEWSIVIPEEKSSEFQQWIHKKAPPAYMRMSWGGGGGGGSAMRQKEGAPEGVMELYSRYEYH